jgi:release factor glutamine methyltransferase
VKRDPRIEIETADGVYSPAEDSELLIESVDPAPGQSVLEVGTGSGIVALHCAAAGAIVTATDMNPDAVKCARRNTIANGLSRGKLDEGCVSFVLCDLANGVRGPFDLVLFNPPYLPGKMGQPAADGGAGGIEVAARLLLDIPRLLAPGGECVIIISSHSDIAALERLFPSLAFQPIRKKQLFFEVLTSYGIRATKKQ